MQTPHALWLCPQVFVTMLPIMSLSMSHCLSPRPPLHLVMPPVSFCATVSLNAPNICLCPQIYACVSISLSALLSFPLSSSPLYLYLSVQSCDIISHQPRRNHIGKPQRIKPRFLTGSFLHFVAIIITSKITSHHLVLMGTPGVKGAL